jgi:hypothetical protein
MASGHVARAPRLCGLLLLVAVPAFAQQGVRRSFGPVTVTLPVGWLEQATKDGPRFVSPDSTAQAYFAFSFYPAHQTAEELRAHHALLWSKVLSLGTPAGPSQSGTLGRFVWSAVQFRGPMGQSEWVRTYSTKVGQTYQAMGVDSTSPILLARHLPEVDAMLARAIFEEEARPPPASTAAVPKGAATSKIPTLPSQDVKVVEAYLQSAIQQRFSVGVGVRQSVVAEDILLFENGVAYRAEVLGGAIDSTVNAYGYATVDVADMKDPPGRRFGRWTQDREAGTLTITWFGGKSVIYRRKGKGLVLEGGSANRKESVDGLRLEGHFEKKMYIGPPVRLVLHKDGRFEEELLVNVLGGAIIDPAFPEKGSGTYEIFKWTLILHFPDGRVRTFNLKYDPAKPDVLLLHTGELKRVG